jgi:hypothetical protein
VAKAIRVPRTAIGTESRQPAGTIGSTILKNGQAVVGLFEGLLEGNALTYNRAGTRTRSRWAPSPTRELQQELQGIGIQFPAEADEGTTGPASFIGVDPDGNPVIVDQHV